MSNHTLQEDKKPIVIRLPEHVKNMFKSYAAQHGLSMNQIIAEYIEELLDYSQTA